MGGAVFLLEHTPEKTHDVWSSLYGASAMGGHLLAALGVFCIHYFGYTENGWRFLYILGCITALFGCQLRTSLHLSPASQKQNLPETAPFSDYVSAFFPLFLCSGFAKATYGAAVVVMQGLLPILSALSATEVAMMNTYLLCLDFILFPLFGWTATVLSRERQMFFATVGIVVLAGPLFHLLSGASFWTVFAIRTIFISLGVAFCAPFYAWAQQLVPPGYRYRFLSVGESIGNQLLGGPTAACALWCFHTTGSSVSAAWYWIALGTITCFALSLKDKIFPRKRALVGIYTNKTNFQL